MKLKLFFLLVAIPCFCQAQTAKFSMLLEKSFGINIHAKDFSAHPGINDLNNFNTDNLYVRTSASLFYKEKFGIEVCYQGNLTSRQNYQGFKSMIETKYPDYFTHYGTLINDHKTSLSTSYFLAGPTAKFNYKKISFIPKLLFGTCEFLTDPVTVYMKKKNGNELITETYSRNKNHGSTLNINAGINLLFILYKGLALNMEFNYFECRVNSKALNYSIQTTNSAGVSSIEHIRYEKQALRTFSIGMGVSYYFKMGKF